MIDSLLTTEDQEERLSLVYAKALAARAGYVTSVPDLDRDSVDLRVQAGGSGHPALDLQLKATTNLGASRNGSRPFPLSIKNYDELRGPTQTPRLLSVLELPSDKSQWMTVTEEELILRRRAYWLNLQTDKYGEKSGQKTTTIYLPDRNLLNVGTLRDLMDKSRRGDF